MTNKDKYLKDGVDVEKLITEIELQIDRKQGRTYTDYELDVALHEFFEQEVKPTLTEDEEVILKKLEKGAHTIGRVSGNDLYVEFCFNDCTVAKELPYSHLFQFIQPRRRI